MHDSFDGMIRRAEPSCAARRLARRNVGAAALCAALVALSLGGCAFGPTGSDDDAAASTSDLTFGAREALPRAAWLAAEAGCEGRLETTEPLRVAFAEGEPELRVVLLRGVPLCVDSTDSVAEELAGHSLETNRVADHIGVVVQPERYGTLSYRRGETAGDPSPQPSAPPQSVVAPKTLEARPNGGDPSPQPSDRTRPTAGEPSPQPSQPNQPIREPLQY